MSNSLKIELTDAEWVSLIDQHDIGLPSCCANISALRDTIITILRDGRQIDPFFNGPEFIRTLCWVEGSHDMGDLPVINKLKEQALQVEDLQRYYEQFQDHKISAKAEV